MLKRQLYDKLKDKLGELLFGFDENQLDVGFFGGDAKLRDLIFRPKKVNEIFEEQNLPFALKAGMIATMDIKVISMKVFLMILSHLCYLLFRSRPGNSSQSQCRSTSRMCTSF